MNHKILLRTGWIWLLLFTMSCENSPVALFRSEGCAVCHMETRESIGPSLRTIALVYRENGGKDRLLDFLNRKSDPIIDPSSFSSMELNLLYTARWEEEKKDLIADYILSIGKREE